VALESLANEYRAVMHIIKRLARRFPNNVLEQMIYLSALTPSAMKDKSAVEQWTSALEVSLVPYKVSGEHFTVTAIEDPDHNTYVPQVSLLCHGLVTDTVFKTEFFGTPEYAQIVTLGQKLQGLLETGAYIKRGDKVQEVDNFAQALEWLMKEAKRGQNIQRYKGLGEMNPDQLWETTMDPNTRRLLQVTIEDAVGADQIFTTLMGDQVDPRREFIEANALSAENIDI